uniref:Uncharacterized protein n=1 Tax=Zea mays TaxID=4577 RepID=A0A804LCW5_MAIZE
MRAEATESSALTAGAAHLLCFAGLAAAHTLAGRGALVSDPALALRLLVVCEAPIVIAVFSYLRRDAKSCSIFKAVARGLICLPVGAFLNAFGAIVLGAPVGIKYWIPTIYWSLLMSLFTQHVSLEHPRLIGKMCFLTPFISCQMMLRTT